MKCYCLEKGAQKGGESLPGVQLGTLTGVMRWGQRVNVLGSQLGQRDSGPAGEWAGWGCPGAPATAPSARKLLQELSVWGKGVCLFNFWL